MTTEEFILQHRKDDVRQLAFQKDKYPEIDMPYVLDQIEGWQRACTKLPEWAATDGIVFPPHISMEQCSSESTALYKQKLSKNLMQEMGMSELIDLTAGFGVDFSYMAKNFKKAIYVERQSHLCKIAKHNLELLDLKHCEVRNADGVEYLNSLEVGKGRLLYLDPARRDGNGAKVFGIEDCTPNVLEIEQQLLDKADVVMVKLSPMLDIHAAMKSLQSITQIHIVSVGNECKELLLVLSKAHTSPVSVFCVNDGQSFDYEYENVENTILLGANAKEFDKGETFAYLYEPNASIMKAGCFGELSARFEVKSIGANSHLFVSNKAVEDFPGRSFRVEAISTMNKKELKKVLAGIDKANIAVRNFPLSVAELRKRLKMKDGGNVYIFATTLGEKDHRLFVCSKI